MGCRNQSMITSELLQKFYRSRWTLFGLYSQLAWIHRRDPEFARLFRRTAVSARRHGRLYGEIYSRHTGRNRNPKVWEILGRTASWMLFLIPVRNKLKIINSIRSRNVLELERMIALREGHPALRYLRMILRDDKRNTKALQRVLAS